MYSNVCERVNSHGENFQPETQVSKTLNIVLIVFHMEILTAWRIVPH